MNVKSHLRYQCEEEVPGALRSWNEGPKLVREDKGCSQRVTMQLSSEREAGGKVGGS